MRSIYYFFALTLGIAANLTAQEDFTLISMDNIQQVQKMNPAFAPTSKINIGIPGISGIYLNYTNSIFTPKQLFSTNGNGTELSTKDIVKNWKRNNHLSFGFEEDILNFGFSLKNNYISVNISEIFNSELVLPGDFLKFPSTGNGDFANEGNVLDFSRFNMSLTHYRALELGFQRSVSSTFSFGVVGKYLYGMENLKTTNNELRMVTNPETYEWRLQGNFDMSSSGIYYNVDDVSNSSILEKGDFAQYLFQKDNRGFGLDLGAKLDVNNKLEVSVSLTDLGFITWKTENRNINVNNLDVSFNGINYSDLILTDEDKIDVDAETTRIKEELEEEFKSFDDGNSYQSYLKPQFHFLTKYKVYQSKESKGTASLLIHNNMVQGMFNPSILVGYTQNLGKWLQASINYGYADKDQNLGAGLALNLGPAQLYLITDNLLAANLAAFKTNGNIDAIFPYAAKNAHFRLGFNIAFGKRENFHKDPNVYEGEGSLLNFKKDK